MPALIRKVREEPPRKPKEYRLSINDMFRDAVLTMLAKRPEDRYATPADLLRDSERVGRYANLQVD